MMNEKNKRLRIWTEQMEVNIPQLFFQHYKELNIQDDEALLLLHLIAFHSEKNDFPTPNDLSKRLQFSENDITLKLQRIIQKGFLEITQGIDQSGKLCERYSVYPLWERILDLLEANSVNQEMSKQQKEEGEVFTLFEQEFGRLLSPMELETISMWLDVDHHSPAIIKSALKEAVLAGKVSLRYIDRILFEWKKKNITSLKQVQKHTEQFHQKMSTGQPTTNKSMEAAPKIPFYNWLDERE